MRAGHVPGSGETTGARGGALFAQAEAANAFTARVEAAALTRWLEGVFSGDIDEPGQALARKKIVEKILTKVFGSVISEINSGPINSGSDEKQRFQLNVNGQTFVFDPAKESIENFAARIQMLPMWSADP